MRLYVASSWRNERQPDVVRRLREAGHEVYDFRHPEPGDRGFHWSGIDEHWQEWTPEAFRDALDDPVAMHGFGQDYRAMAWANAGVLVLPCGRSAHLEADYFVGAGKPLFILLADGEPELMYRMALVSGRISLDVDELLRSLSGIKGNMVGHTRHELIDGKIEQAMGLLLIAHEASGRGRSPFQHALIRRALEDLQSAIGSEVLERCELWAHAEEGMALAES